MAKKYGSKGSFQSLVLKQHHVFVNSFRFITSAFCPTSIWIVSFIEMKVFQDLSDQVSSKTVNVLFVMIKLMSGTNSPTQLLSCKLFMLVLSSCYNSFICPLFLWLQIMDSSKRARIESGSTPHKPERTEPNNGIYNTQHSQQTCV